MFSVKRTVKEYARIQVRSSFLYHSKKHFLTFCRVAEMRIALAFETRFGRITARWARTQAVGGCVGPIRALFPLFSADGSAPVPALPETAA